jgi:hypothetical protein
MHQVTTGSWSTKAVRKITRDEDVLRAFYDLPAGRWID